MKTKAVLLLLQLAAKRYMSEAEYAAFKQRILFMRWQQIRQNWPEIWEDFSERFEAIRDRFTRNADPEMIVAEAYPGGIQSYPQVFEYFALHEQVSLIDIPSTLEPIEFTGGEEEGVSCLEGIFGLLGGLLEDLFD